MKMTVLGCQGPYPAAGGACSGYLTCWENAEIALDMGCGTLATLTERMPPEGLTGLLLSHWHGDHCSDVLPLLYRMESVCREGARPLTIYAPVDAASPVRQAVQACKAVILRDVQPGDTLMLGDVAVQVFAARHPVPAVMYRLTGQGQTLCYTGDTNETDGLTDFARNADLLLADGLFPAAVWSADKPHLSAEKAAGLARASGAKRLIVTHLNPAFDPETLLREARSVYPAAELAHIGQTYSL